jgi:histidine ammonia-lyase
MREVEALCAALAGSEDFHGGSAVRAALDAVRSRVSFMQRDRAMDGEVRAICALVRERILGLHGLWQTREHPA